MRLTVRRLFLWLLFAAVAAVIGILFLLLRQFDASKLGTDFNQRTTGELIRYARIRLMGHQILEPLLLPALAYAETQAQRSPPQLKLPSLAKGQQPQPLPKQRYDAQGLPLAEEPQAGAGPADSSWSELRVSTAAELARAMQSAKPGQTIVLNPGRYRITETLSTGATGQKDLPISVKARQVGQVRLESMTADVFKVSHGFWVFENLQMRGSCPVQSDCKHAFLVQGGARSTVIRNNLMEDFNAHLQVNGDEDEWPDEGLVQFNTFSNSRARDTAAVVAPINIIGASKWRLLDNHISHFVKRGGGQSSFGMLVRGAGHGTRIERNLLICTPQQITQPGIRTGISFGGSASEPRFCRDQQCEFEQRAAVAANNVVAHCNDFGIDVNRSASMLIAHNTLVNTAGIDMRGAKSNGTVYGNLLDGRIRERDGAQIKASMNEVLDLGITLEDADALRLNWRRSVEAVPSHPLVKDDFCGTQRNNATQVGALAELKSACLPRVLDAKSVQP
ncbi:right-handed parallel beta-helix repeat-containing protein [Paucibacter sp. Y2R2-4]|uniref:right-handed parallel beta-helix repeat-containing protein n=1 Tax=Paucibacter sp. Y2R2-4 TaxID=2893553 RepID=UPI0021E39661|nr:right-handed parallel beta-helix repeat-containing protein [Paucibacter sp. Y2R2-4]MCV2352153.1 right-handed parallel beta-helix repeat-containing protein [Paucibacter sp. Y2R2-4]